MAGLFGQFATSTIKKLHFKNGSVPQDVSRISRKDLVGEMIMMITKILHAPEEISISTHSTMARENIQVNNNSNNYQLFNILTKSFMRSMVILICHLWILNRIRKNENPVVHHRVLPRNFCDIRSNIFTGIMEEYTKESATFFLIIITQNNAEVTFDKGRSVTIKKQQIIGELGLASWGLSQDIYKGVPMNTNARFFTNDNQ
ncbi:hypothetical protein ACTFIZ_002925 [Dictyostelium cf. discoideum]